MRREEREDETLGLVKAYIFLSFSVFLLLVFGLLPPSSGGLRRDNIRFDVDFPLDNGPFGGGDSGTSGGDLDTIIEGYVFDSETGDPIPGAQVEGTVYSDPIPVSALTDENGRFRVVLPEDLENGAHPYSLSVSAPGYDSRVLGGSVAKGEDRRLDVLLDFNPLSLSLSPPSGSLVRGWSEFPASDPYDRQSGDPEVSSATENVYEYDLHYVYAGTRYNAVFGYSGANFNQFFRYSGTNYNQIFTYSGTNYNQVFTYNWTEYDIKYDYSWVTRNVYYQYSGTNHNQEWYYRFTASGYSGYTWLDLYYGSTYTSGGVTYYYQGQVRDRSTSSAGTTEYDTDQGSSFTQNYYSEGYLDGYIAWTKIGTREVQTGSGTVTYTTYQGSGWTSGTDPYTVYQFSQQRDEPTGLTGSVSYDTYQGSGWNSGGDPYKLYAYYGSSYVSEGSAGTRYEDLDQGPTFRTYDYKDGYIEWTKTDSAYQSEGSAGTRDFDVDQGTVDFKTYDYKDGYILWSGSSRVAGIYVSEGPAGSVSWDTEDADGEAHETGKRWQYTLSYYAGGSHTFWTGAWYGEYYLGSEGVYTYQGLSRSYDYKDGYIEWEGRSVSYLNEGSAGTRQESENRGPSFRTYDYKDGYIEWAFQGTENVPRLVGYRLHTVLTRRYDRVQNMDYKEQPWGVLSASVASVRLNGYAGPIQYAVTAPEYLGCSLGSSLTVSPTSSVTDGSYYVGVLAYAVDPSGKLRLVDAEVFTANLSTTQKPAPYVKVLQTDYRQSVENLDITADSSSLPQNYIFGTVHNFYTGGRLGGVTVRLVHDGNTIATTTSDSDGVFYFYFPEWPINQILWVEAEKSGWLQGIPVDVSVHTGSSGPVVVSVYMFKGDYQLEHGHGYADIQTSAIDSTNFAVKYNVPAPVSAFVPYGWPGWTGGAVNWTWEWVDTYYSSAWEVPRSYFLPSGSSESGADVLGFKAIFSRSPVGVINETLVCEDHWGAFGMIRHSPADPTVVAPLNDSTVEFVGYHVHLYGW